MEDAPAPEEVSSERITSHTDLVTPLPRKRVVTLCLVLFGESFVASVLFPFVSFMVRDFGVAEDDESIGYYAGYLASAFFFGQFVSSFFWGWLSDRVGRRPILLIGLVGSSISILTFGFSSSYAMATGARLFGGLINSNWSIARAYLGDITDKTNRVRAFGFIGMMWGAGTIVGPALGGVLSNPLENFGFLGIFHEGSVWETHPYFLPTVVGAVISIVALIMAFFLLPESKVFTTDAVPLSNLATGASMDDGEAKVTVEGEGLLEKKKKKQRPAPKTKPSLKSFFFKESKYVSLNETSSDGANDTKMNDGESGEDDVEVDVMDDVDMDDDDDKEDLPTQSSRSKLHHLIMRPLHSSGLTAVARDKGAVLTIASVGTTGLLYVIIDEVFPLWAMTTLAQGGLNFSSAQIGLTWSIGGASLVLYQMFVYYRLARRFGTLKLFQAGLALMIVTFIFYPFNGLVARSSSNPAILWVTLGTTIILRTIFGNTIGTSQSVLLNCCGGEDIQRYRGMINGLANALSGLFRSIGPFVGASVFAWSLASGLPMPFDFHFVFFLEAALAALNLTLSCFIPAQQI
eukprot:TRINITY_DN2151_c0_g1_i6.p1 TRINITY_DN2151_c0_g1~~TRINITY_DN2151_c0_g1_i6.p1  ORF type:complete len:574 (-),score=120.49 TRINITY_DN2151_c0_g1_i6:28-1749(-)